MYKLIEKLQNNGCLLIEEYECLVSGAMSFFAGEKDERFAEVLEKLRCLAEKKRKEVYGNAIFIRGLIEISNFCKNDCFYCGIRKSNKSCSRYRLSDIQILDCVKKGYSLGFRTFVLQGGEDAAFTDERLCRIISTIKKKYPDCAVTLSLGERSYQSYKLLFDAGADRYLLRHETADCGHYARLHPKNLNLKSRMKCLTYLKKIGFQTGCGFMVGSPSQTAKTIAQDLKFIEEFSPDMCGIGPFIPHKDTPFAECDSGSVELTCFLLSLIRLIKPNILLPSTTALNSLHPNGRQMGILAGANVIMPNLSPDVAKDKYTLYNNKANTGIESAEGLLELKKCMLEIGYEIVTDKGDIKNI